jgi:16S rRNA (adenine1518-N6/adenine1519-N6)-dimethyltransferase
MDEPGLESVPRLLKRYGIRPSKSLGQNFLVDRAALDRVVAAAEIQSGDEVLEIGSGLGNLTRRLAEAAKRVVTVEIDEKFLPVLRDVLGAYDHVEIVHADILEVDLGDLFERPGYLVVANIPYYITSALMRHLLEAPNPPARLALTVQREVAERICAQAGRLSLLALSVQVYGGAKIAAKIPAGAFYPTPKVDSAVVRVDNYSQPLVPRDKLDVFFRLVKAGFSQKRKTLRNSLAGGMGWGKDRAEAALRDAQIDPQRRAQTLSIEEWGRLVDGLIFGEG